MAELQHEKAYYRDTQGALKEIDARELGSNERFEFARSTQLTDRDEMVRLCPRKASSQSRAHFYCPSPTRFRVFSGEFDPVHNQHVYALGKRLRALPAAWKLNYWERERTTSLVLSLPKYSWGQEVTRIVDAGVIVRHDIYGEFLSLAMSKLRPAIAIEVVHTHFPEEAAFQALLEESRRTPKYIFLESATRPNRFVSIDKDSITFRYYTFYIFEGKLMQGRSVIDNATSEELRVRFTKLIAKWT